MASELDDAFKAKVVAAILDAHPEKALALLSEHFHLDEPAIRVGVVKGRSKRVRAVYLRGRKEIIAAKREYLYDPFTVLHEFYHHLRYIGGEQRGTEKYADRFALGFVEAYIRSRLKLKDKF